MGKVKIPYGRCLLRYLYFLKGAQPPPANSSLIDLLCGLVGFTWEAARSYPPDCQLPICSPTQDVVLPDWSCWISMTRDSGTHPLRDPCSYRVRTFRNLAHDIWKGRGNFPGHCCDETITECSHSVWCVDYSQTFWVLKKRADSGVHWVKTPASGLIICEILGEFLGLWVLGFTYL